MPEVLLCLLGIARAFQGLLLDFSQSNIYCSLPEVLLILHFDHLHGYVLHFVAFNLFAYEILSCQRSVKS